MNQRQPIFGEQLRLHIDNVARSRGDVLITGPRGAGKTLAARLVHERSGSRGPFVPVNCAAIAPGLFESELFGHVRGAFPGAHAQKEGYVARAAGGTLFLDEIAELTLHFQAALLQLLQERTFYMVGSATLRTADFRLLCATNEDLIALMRKGAFREDLFDRLHMLGIVLPPLRAEPLIWQRIADDEARALWPQDKTLQQHALSAIERLSREPGAWPGNVRELLSFMVRFGLDPAEETHTRERWRLQVRAAPVVRATPVLPAYRDLPDDVERFAAMIQRTLAPGQAEPRVAELRGRSAASAARPPAPGERDLVDPRIRRGSNKRLGAKPREAAALASRLLRCASDGTPPSELAKVLGDCDLRTLKANLEPLVKANLLRVTSAGYHALWPPAAIWLLVHDGEQGGWCPVKPGAIPHVRPGQRVRLEISTRWAGHASIALVTYLAGGEWHETGVLDREHVHDGRTLVKELELDGEVGVEQLLVHFAPESVRGGNHVDPVEMRPLMPSAEHLERGRASALGRWGDGWLAEYLLFHGAAVAGAAP